MDLCIIIIILLILHFVLNSMCNTKDNLKYYVYKSKLKGPTILMVGGTHGNEPAGHHSLNILKHNLDQNIIKIKKGKLILVPSVNECGLKVGLRMIPFVWDLNRKYPTESNYDKTDYNKSCPINAKVAELAEQSDFILDFHEGWGFHRENKKSMGSSISPTDTKTAYDIAHILYDKLNETIKENYRKFTILSSKEIKDMVNQGILENTNQHAEYSKKENIMGSLSNYANVIKKSHILIETSGQKNIQSIQERIRQNAIIIYNVLKYYHML